MKHLFSLFILVVLSAATAKAQSNNRTWRVGFGIDAGIATSDAFKYAIGGDIRIQKDFNPRVSGTLTTGFSHFFEKDHFAGYSQYGSPYNVIPVKLGIRYFVGDNLYLGGEAGAGFAFEQWGTSFVWSPSVGMAFKNGIDLSLKYEDYTKDKATKTLGLRLAYGFSARSMDAQKKSASPANVTNSEIGISFNPGVDVNSSDNKILGGDVTLYQPVTNNLVATFSAGYTHMNTQYLSTYGIMDGNGNVYYNYNLTVRNVVPVKIGLRVFWGDMFYLGGEAGVAFASRRNTTFVYSPLLGVKFKNGLDIGAKYENYDNRLVQDALSFKLGYHFKL
ncbi:outer membrane beta-barrel protein [Mucilaginibacter sp.]|uniref:outer membrane beta-barrel protein n=1 Tax=Mucilaginibacter sp. TaxID=1882438 RepID=UPI002ED6789A